MEATIDSMQYGMNAAESATRSSESATRSGSIRLADFNASETNSDWAGNDQATALRRLSAAGCYPTSMTNAVAKGVLEAGVSGSVSVERTQAASLALLARRVQETLRNSVGVAQ